MSNREELKIQASSQATLSLSRCTFYVQNMLAMQMKCPLIFFSEYREKIEVPETYVVDLAFDNVISRKDLEFSTAGIECRFKGLTEIHGLTGTIGACIALREVSRKPVQQRGEPDAKFCLRMFHYYSHVVRSFYYMVSLAKYANNKDDYELPVAPQLIDPPIELTARCFLIQYKELTDTLMRSLLDAFSDDLCPSPIVRSYATDVIVPEIAGYRNLIYSAFCVCTNKKES